MMYPTTKSSLLAMNVLACIVNSEIICTHLMEGNYGILDVCEIIVFANQEKGFLRSGLYFLFCIGFLWSDQ